MPKKLILRNILGKHSFHVFDQNGTNVIVECTGQEYAALAQKDAKPQTAFPYRWANKRHEYLIDAVWCPWKMSFENYKFDTTDGWLQEGDYFDNGATYKVQLNGREGDIDKAQIIDGDMSVEGLLEMARKPVITAFSQK